MAVALDRDDSTINIVICINTRYYYSTKFDTECNKLNRRWSN